MAIRQSTALIALTEYVARQLVATKGIRRDRIDVIPHGVFRAPSPSDLPLDLASPKLLFFGRILKYKGLDTLLKAFPRIKSQIPRAQLVVAGEGDVTPYRDLLAGQQDVTLVNRWLNDTEINRLFQQAALVILPYAEATQSGVVALAFGFGRPVVVTRVGGLPEQVEEGVTGTIVPPRDERALADRVVELLSSPETLLTMSRQARAAAQGPISWDRIATMHLDCYRKALERTRR
jgi:glycosyltransferase involved in cell wall biosynthesis